MLTDFAAGGVVTTPDGLVVLIRPHNRAHVLALPKGHPEGSETPQEGAVREVREETGFDATVEQPERSATATYWKLMKGKACLKTVRYFRMHVTGGCKDDHDGEVDEVMVMERREAVRRITHERERRVLRTLLEGEAGRTDEEAGTKGMTGMLVKAWAVVLAVGVAVTMAALWRG